MGSSRRLIRFLSPWAALVFSLTRCLFYAHLFSPLWRFFHVTGNITTNTKYPLLAQTPDGSPVVYSITHLEASTQYRRQSSFAASMASMALNRQTITYTLAVEGAPIFNSFDTTAGTWGRPGLLTGGHTKYTSPLPFGTIISGAVGGLLLIALSVFLIVQFSRRRRSQHMVIIETKHEQDHDRSNGLGNSLCTQSNRGSSNSNNSNKLSITRSMPKTHSTPTLRLPGITSLSAAAILSSR